MDSKLIKLRFRFNILSLPYADFIRDMFSIGILMSPYHKTFSDSIILTVEVDAETAVFLKLKFSEFIDLSGYRKFDNNDLEEWA